MTSSHQQAAAVPNVAATVMNCILTAGVMTAVVVMSRSMSMFMRATTIILFMLMIFDDHNNEGS